MTQSFSRASGIAAGRVQGMTAAELTALGKSGTLVPSAIFALTPLVAAREAMEKILEQMRNTPEKADVNKLLGLDDQSAEKTKSFFESLQKQLDDLRAKTVELRGGPTAGLALELEDSFKRLGNAAPDVRAKFEALKNQILGLSAAFQRAKLDADLLKSKLEEADKSFPEPLLPGELQLSPAQDFQDSLAKIRQGLILTEDEFKKYTDAMRSVDQIMQDILPTLDAMENGDETLANRSQAVVAAMDELRAQFLLIDREAVVFGTDFDALAEKIAAVKAEIQSSWPRG